MHNNQQKHFFYQHCAWHFLVQWEQQEEKPKVWEVLTNGRGAATEWLSLVGLVKKVAPRHVDPDFVLNECLGLFVRCSAPRLAQPTPGKEDLSFSLQVAGGEEVPTGSLAGRDGNQFIQGHLHDLHKSTFSPKQFLIQSLYLSKHPSSSFTLAQGTRKVAGE